MGLVQLLQQIQKNNKKDNDLYQANTGKRFEEIFLEKITDLGYIRVLKSTFIKNFQNVMGDFKEEVLQMDIDKGLIKNNYFKKIATKRQIVIHQPFGKQKYPDFLLINNSYVLPVEIKYSTKNGNKPTWNSGLPRSSGVYLFGSFNKKEITFFAGQFIMQPSYRRQLISIFDFAEEQMKKRIKESKLDKSFSLYLRRMYNQTFDAFKWDKRLEVETKTIEFVKKFEEKDWI